MEKLINFCGKYRKFIFAILMIVVLLLLCFPLRDTVFPSGAKKTVSDHDPAFIAEKVVQTPFFFASFYWLFNASQYNILGDEGKQFFYQQIFSFFLLIAFVLSTIAFWIREKQHKKNIALLPLIFAFISHTLLCMRYKLNDDMSVSLVFSANPSFIILIVLICLYAFALLFGKLYPRMRPKVAEAVTKVKSHKTKAQRIEELERQNAEMQNRLDEIERKG